jgi:dihydrofolate synthase/folylpolyglutamate synthase
VKTVSTPEQALAFFSSLEASGKNLGLDRIRAGMDALGNPEAQLLTLHVAGTNGKGSTCAFTASCLQEAGYRVGLYTSPHLVRINERIRNNGEDIPDALLAQRILEVVERYPAALATPAPLTFFEFATLVALWHFWKAQVDVVVLETGLGGRLDATSVARPLLTAITPISFDHMEQLGNTLASIAGEKAGIFKRGIPVVCSRQDPEAFEVLRKKADALGAPMRCEGRDFQMEQHPSSTAEAPLYVYRSERGTFGPLTLGLRGPHQRQNAAVALACLESLEKAGLRVTDEQKRAGLLKVHWPGRFEEVATRPSVVLDGAHNPAGARTLLEALDALYPGRNVHLVFAVLSDKEHGPMLRGLFPRCQSVHLTPVDSSRSLAPEKYLAEARALNPDVSVYASVQRALEGARSRAHVNDVVLCAGSLYLVGQVKKAL